MNRTTFFGGPVPFFLIVMATLIFLAAPAVQPVFAASSGECVTANVETPFRLPDGRLYPAGPLTLCDNGTFSPVDTMQRILVGGSTIGQFRSRRRNAETVSMPSPQIVFNRNADGSLELIGYAVQDSGCTIAYRLRGTGDAWQASLHQRIGGANAPFAAIVAVAGTR